MIDGFVDIAIEIEAVLEFADDVWGGDAVPIPLPILDEVHGLLGTAKELGCGEVVTVENRRTDATGDPDF